jgi:hypothetical protein
VLVIGTVASVSQLPRGHGYLKRKLFPKSDYMQDMGLIRKEGWGFPGGKVTFPYKTQ